MARPEVGLSAGAKLAFVLENELLWKLGEAAPTKEPGTPGAPRHYSEWVWYLYDASVSIYLSARKGAAELAAAWPQVIAASKARYPDRPDLWAPAEPPARHHWQYAKKRLRGRSGLYDAIAVFEQISAEQAIEMGIADPSLGSISHPHALNAFTSDGKVITPPYKAKRNTPIADRETGEILGYKKADPHAMLHITGGGHPAYGNKFVMIAGRTPDWHGRMILSLDHVATKSGEAEKAVDCLERIVPHFRGALAFIYDGALRGIHVRRLLRELGIQPVSPPTAAKAKTAEQDREEKVTLIETIVNAQGQRVSLYARGGQIGVGDFDGDGNELFEPMMRIATKRRTNVDGTFRWYGVYRLPTHLGGDEILVRADTTDDDRRRKVNRSENFRLMPPGDPDYETLYPLRSDIEANNRQLEDTLWINRAHSVGAPAQLLDLLGYALLYNSVAVGLARSRRRRVVEAA